MVEKMKNDRLTNIDFVRGLAAISVFLCHISCLFLPGLYFANSYSNVFENVWRDSPLNCLTNGDLAVQFFFIISGFLITKKMFELEKKETTFRFEKYLLTKIFVFLKIVIIGLTFAFALSPLIIFLRNKNLESSYSLTLLSDYFNSGTSFKTYLFDFINVFKNGSSYLDSPLWTIKHELIGAIFMTLLSYYSSKSNSCLFHKIILYSVFCVLSLFVDYYICSFLFGGIIYLIVQTFEDDNRYSTIISKVLNNKIVIILLLIIGFYFAAINTIPLTGIYKWLQPIQKGSQIIRAFGLSIILLYFLRLSFKPSDKNIFVRLGGISVYIYILHWPIICSMGLLLYNLLVDEINYYLVVMIASFSSLIVTILFSFVLYKIKIFVNKLFFSIGKKKKDNY